MGRRLYLVDSSSLYTTSQMCYRGKIDYRCLMDRMKQETGSIDMEAVVFHGEPKKTSSAGFIELLRSVGFSTVVIPSRVLSSPTIVDTRCIPLHLSAYLFPRLGKFTHYDFISGDVDYSPITSYLIQEGFYVRLWLFADRIPHYEQGEEVAHSIVPMNEGYICSLRPQ